MMLLDFDALPPVALHAALREATVAGGYDVEARGETFTASSVLSVTATHITFGLKDSSYVVPRENILRIIVNG